MSAEAPVEPAPPVEPVAVDGAVTEVESLPFIPDKVTTYNPDGAVVETNPDNGAVRLTFIFYRTNEVVCFNISPLAAGAIKDELPASSTVLTPPRPRVFLPGE